MRLCRSCSGVCHRPSSKRPDAAGDRWVTVWPGLLLLNASIGAAHPLGNTSVNLYERVDVGAQEISIRFVLDISEFPALRERAFADTNDDGAVDDAETTAYLDGFWQYLEPLLKLVVDDQPVPIHRVQQRLTFPPGQGGLSLMRAEYDLSATQPAQTPGGRGRGLAHRNGI